MSLLTNMLDALGYLVWPIAVLAVIIASAVLITATEDWLEARAIAREECRRRHPASRGGVPWV